MAPIGMILSAGFGTRLKPLTELRPKPLMEIGGRPIIYHLIRMLEKAGVEDIILNLHYLPKQIENYINNNSFKARIHMVVEQSILGTAGGVRNALNSLNLQPNSMILMHGDILCDINLRHYSLEDSLCMLICEKNRSIAEYEGSVGIDERGCIAVLGKFFQSSNLVVERGFFTGIQYLSQEALKFIQQSSEESLVAELYPLWLKQGYAVTACMEPIIYEDLGSAPRIFAANMNIIGNPCHFKYIDFLDGFTEIGKGIFVGKNVFIDKKACLIGPLIIADNTHVADGAIIGPRVVIGENCLVNQNAVIKNSVIMSSTTIEKMAHMDCILALSSARVKVRGFFEGESCSS